MLIFALSVVPNAQNRPQIFHQIPKTFSYEQFDWLRCVVESGDYHLLNVRFFVREPDKTFFTEYQPINEDGVYTLRIIPEMVRGDSFSYFITAEFSDFSLIAFPAENPEEHPIVVPIVQEKRAVKVISTAEISKIFCDLGQNIDPVQSVTIYLRYGQSGRFAPEPMKYQKERFQYAVRESTGKDEKLYFFIIILFKDQTTLSYPSEEFDRHPDYRILMGRRK
ncbi:MAG: hypothetical protein ACP5FZ_08725 [Fidelibacterota bacterium]